MSDTKTERLFTKALAAARKGKGKGRALVFASKIPSVSSHDALKDLPESVGAAFGELGWAQRGLPEDAMLEVQDFHSGPLNSLVEHVGDLTNRMTVSLPRNDAGYGYVRNKVKMALDKLSTTEGRSFDQEHQENIVNNSRYRKVDPNEYKAKLDSLLKKYRDAHAELPVFNEAQWNARQAAIALGNQNWGEAVKCLKKLDAHLGDSESWVAYAHEYKLDGSGNPQLKRP